MPIAERLTIHRHLDHALIRMAGDFDVDESEALDELANALFSEFTATVEVDMTEVTFFGSRALSALLHLGNEVARHSGAEMHVTGFNDQVRRLFELTGVMEAFTMGTAPLPMPHVA